MPQAAVDFALIGKAMETACETSGTVQERVPFAYETPIILGDCGTSLWAMAGEPFWEDTFGVLLIERTAIDCIHRKVTFDKKALNL